MSNEDVIPPPSSFTVEFERRPVLYLPDGRALVRQAGFTMQTSQTFPELTKKVPKGKGKKR